MSIPYQAYEVLNALEEELVEPHLARFRRLRDVFLRLAEARSVNMRNPEALRADIVAGLRFDATSLRTTKRKRDHREANSLERLAELLLAVDLSDLFTEENA